MTFTVNPDWTWNELETHATAHIDALDKELTKCLEWIAFKRSQDALYSEVLEQLMAANDKRLAVMREALAAYHRGYLTGEGRSTREGYEKAAIILEGLE